jgi:nitronate monooxygenase
MKIGKHNIEKHIIQGGMGLGISWDKLAGTVSLHGALGVVSSVGTGYYQNKEYSKKNIKDKPWTQGNFYNKEALTAIIKNARKICGDKPLGCNVLYASNDYGRIVEDACEAGADIIITGAGIPTSMPKFTQNYPDVAIVPIVSSARALKLICKKWKKYNRLPDAVIVEGPLSGGHQGFNYEQCFMDEFQLESIVPSIIEEAKNWGSMPVIAAGGIWDKNDIDKYITMGCAGVQMGTRFLGTYECDASDVFKDVIINSTKETIKLQKSPVGLPARAVVTHLQKSVIEKTAPKVSCISNCVAPCKSGIEAKVVGYCIADRLADAYKGEENTGLFFTGSNGYRVDKLYSVKDILDRLTNGE